jgi:hypothetical protein
VVTVIVRVWCAGAWSEDRGEGKGGSGVSVTIGVWNENQGGSEGQNRMEYRYSFTNYSNYCRSSDPDPSDVEEQTEILEFYSSQVINPNIY